MLDYGPDAIIMKDLDARTAASAHYLKRGGYAAAKKDPHREHVSRDVVSAVKKSLCAGRRRGGLSDASSGSFMRGSSGMKYLVCNRTRRAGNLQGPRHSQLQPSYGHRRHGDRATHGGGRGL